MVPGVKFGHVFAEFLNHTFSDSAGLYKYPCMTCPIPWAWALDPSAMEPSSVCQFVSWAAADGIQGHTNIWRHHWCEAIYLEVTVHIPANIHQIPTWIYIKSEFTDWYRTAMCQNKNKTDLRSICEIYLYGPLFAIRPQGSRKSSAIAPCAFTAM